MLPLRGKILNVASAGKDKLAQNQQLADLVQALGCGTGAHYREEDLRYDKVIIMTDADVDGAHIASLLITFFYRQMPKLIEGGHLFSRCRRSTASRMAARRSMRATTSTRTILLKKEFHANAKVEIGRFKGLGEMMAAQLKETTMDPQEAHAAARRCWPTSDKAKTAKSVDQLMGTKPEARFAFISGERAEFAKRRIAGRVGADHCRREAPEPMTAERSLRPRQSSSGTVLIDVIPARPCLLIFFFRGFIGSRTSDCRP